MHGRDPKNLIIKIIMTMSRDEIIGRFILAQDLLYKLRESRSTVAEQRLTPLDLFGEGLIDKFYLSSLSLRRQIGEDTFVSMIDGKQLIYVIDPITAASTTRAMYESMLTFFHIYIDAPSQEERELRFRLWHLSSIISWLKTAPTGSQVVEEYRLEQEQNKTTVINQIAAMPIVDSLSVGSKRKIEQKRESGASDKWAYYVDGTELKEAGGITGIQSRLKAKPEAFVNFYSIFSTDAHPTFASVDKVLRAFFFKNDEEPDNWRLFSENLHYATTMMILLIHDYCVYFPRVRVAFNALAQEHKDFINHYIEQFKGPEYCL